MERITSKAPDRNSGDGSNANRYIDANVAKIIAKDVAKFLKTFLMKKLETSSFSSSVLWLIFMHKSALTTKKWIDLLLLFFIKFALFHRTYLLSRF